MEKVILNAEMREEKGKALVKKIRTQGLVPAVCYKEGKESVNLKIKSTDLYHVLHTKAGENVLITLSVGGAKAGKERLVIIKEVQTEPLRGQVIHIDFNEVSLTKKIKVKVPVVTKGEAKEVLSASGVIEHTIWEVEVECLPMSIPEKLFVDIDGMKIGDTKLVKDLLGAEDVKVLTDPELVIISAKPPAKEEVKEVLPGEEAAEPEVIAKGKKPEEGEEAEEGAAKPAPAPKEEKK